MYKSILIPTDGSEFCLRAIQHGVALAKFAKCKVVGVTVAQPLHTGTPKALIPDHLAALIQAESAKLAGENLAAIELAAKAAGVPVEMVKATGDYPWEAIIKTAKDKGCDLIVMASHGRSGVSAVVLGSETHKVLTHATVPVLVVR